MKEVITFIDLHILQEHEYDPENLIAFFEEIESGLDEIISGLLATQA